jgi:hypothetical protein
MTNKIKFHKGDDDYVDFGTNNYKKEKVKTR